MAVGSRSTIRSSSLTSDHRYSVDLPPGRTRHVTRQQLARRFQLRRRQHLLAPANPSTCPCSCETGLRPLDDEVPFHLPQGASHQEDEAAHRRRGINGLHPGTRPDASCFAPRGPASTPRGCEMVFTDTMSGSNADRPGLAQAMSHVWTDDTPQGVLLGGQFLSLRTHPPNRTRAGPPFESLLPVCAT